MASRYAQPYFTFVDPLYNANPPKQVCEECQATTQHKVADDAAIEKLFEEFKTTLQTRVADVIKQVCEEFKATLPHMLAESAQAIPQDRKDPLLVVTDCSDTESEEDVLSPLHHNTDQDRNHRWDSSFIVWIPEFHGLSSSSSSPEAFLDWLITVEEVLDFKKVPEEHRVSLVATSFRGHAAFWWNRFKLQRALCNKEKLNSWEELKKHMKRVFLPDKYNYLMLQKFNNIRQGSRTVDEYATEFFQLMSRSDDIHDSERQLVARFIAGLEPRLQKMVSQFKPVTVTEARERAVVMEQQARVGSSMWDFLYH